MNTQTNARQVWEQSSLIAYGIGTSFFVYFCMYAFRKPFAAAEYEGLTLWNGEVELKTAFAVSQLLGYTTAKFLGIRICSEMRPQWRAGGLVLVIAIAEIALLMFALLPPTGKVAAMFVNGLALGMVWGLVVWYLEGRRTSEVMLAGLSCSFILASACVKDVGRAAMKYAHISEFWMPFSVGLLFLPPFVVFVWLLNRIPPPDENDRQARVERTTMTQADRAVFFRQFAIGLTLLLTTYIVLTAYREYRDAFGIEIFGALGYKDIDGQFTLSESWVTFGVLGVLAGLNLIRNNRWGLVGAFGVMMLGTVMLGVSTYAYDQNWVSGFTWMILTGLGLYLAYVPFGSVLFDRMIAYTRATGNAVFGIYVADTIGYIGSVVMMVCKDMIAGGLTKLEFFHNFSYFMAASGTICLLGSCIYFTCYPVPFRQSAAESARYELWRESETE